MMEAATSAQKSWAKTPLWKRAELLHKAAAILKEHKAPIADCLVKEIAKPAKDAVTEVYHCLFSRDLGKINSGNLCHQCVKVKSSVTIFPSKRFPAASALNIRVVSK